MSGTDVDNVPLYVVYSEKQRKFINLIRNCTKINLRTYPSPAYEYARKDGTIVVCTEVGRQRGCPTNMWDDKQDLGEVVRFIRVLER